MHTDWKGRNNLSLFTNMSLLMSKVPNLQKKALLKQMSLAVSGKKINIQKPITLLYINTSSEQMEIETINSMSYNSTKKALNTQV